MSLVKTKMCLTICTKHQLTNAIEMWPIEILIWQTVRNGKKKCRKYLIFYDEKLQDQKI